MAPWARSKFDASVFETEVFRKQMYCIDRRGLTIRLKRLKPRAPNLRGPQNFGE